MNHSSLPWHYQEDSDAYTHIIRCEKDRIVAHFRQDTSGLQEANAAFIVKAVNNHYSLKEALRLCMEVIELEIVDGEYTDAFIIGSRAIKQAEAE